MIDAPRSRALARIALLLVLSAVTYLVLYWYTPARALDIEIITDVPQGGWEALEGRCSGAAAETAEILFVPGPPNGDDPAPRGTGSVNFNINANGNSFAFIRNERWFGLNLEEITAADGRLSYAVHVQSPGTDPDPDPDVLRAPYMVIEIDRNNDGTPDDKLVHEPRLNGGVTPGVWAQFNAKAGRWWSTTDREAGTGARPNATQNLTTFRSRFPLAEIVSIWVGAGPLEDTAWDGCGDAGATPPRAPAWTGFSGNVDILMTKIFTHEVLFDFEHPETEEEPSEGTPVPTPTRTRSPSPSGSTTSASPSPSESSPDPDPTNTQNPRCQGRAGQNVITGTSRGETIRGTDRDDLICAFGGDDVVAGRGGDDELRLGPGNDRGSGNAGWDDISGAGGRDVIDGDAGSDDLFGGRGRDRCIGGPGRDRFRSCERRLR